MNAHVCPTHCSCCAISRRCFLAGSAAALGSSMALAKQTKSAAGNELAEYIELERFRPKPEVRIIGAVVRQKPPYWLGWPGTSYDVEGHRAEYIRTFSAAARAVGVGIEDVEAPLEDIEAVNTFANWIQAEKPDAVLLTLQHLNVWPWVEVLSKTGTPVIVFAPVGTAFTQHLSDISRRPGVHVISSLDTGAVTQAMRMVRAHRQMQATRLLVLRGEENVESTIEGLGVKVKQIPRAALHELFERMPETDETQDVARAMRRGAKRVVEPTRQDTLHAARSFQTAKRLLLEHEANAITSDCLGMVSSKVVPTPPCMAAALFQDEGVTYGCEADQFGAVSLMFTSYLFDKPGFMNDPVPETVKNVLIAAHCTSGTRLNGFTEPREDYVLRSHSESGLGVSMQVLWREGQPVTLVRFQKPDEVIVDTGTVVANVQTPPAGGCRTNFEIALDNVDDSRNVLGFHQVVFYGDHRRDIQAYAQMYGIKVIHSPEHYATPPATA